eukprot:TRINITY_DN4939_c0_g1_i4.p1 TRINITY_DN4939_c0_g1~~TRINITY_DN4939_c0_g1_i4.p1  ORF type:complete len:404 (+),score=98.33 TRINITY_DN4939_c0_g1_i4:266-1477(+)
MPSQYFKLLVAAALIAVTLLAPAFLFSSTSSAPATPAAVTGFESTAIQFNGSAINDLPESRSVRNVYEVSTRLLRIDGSPVANAYVRYWGQNLFRPVFPQTPVSFPFKMIVTESSLAASNYSLVFYDPYHVVGLFKSPADIFNNNASTWFGFSEYSNASDALLASWNITDDVISNFPNVTSLDPMKLWPTVTFNSSVVSSSGVTATYEVIFRGAVDAFGVEVKYPLWKIVVMVMAAKTVFCFVIALVDYCCQPLTRATACDKFKILVGNTLWLVFGGLITGIVYWLAGVLLMLTIVFLPFGVKLVRFAVFSLFPFGREVKQDVNSDGFCTLFGNVIWLLLVGIPLVVLHFVLGIVFIVLILTIPFGLQHLKLSKIAFMPFGHSVVYREDLHRGDGYERAPRYA